jgi:phage terminase small subunit
MRNPYRRRPDDEKASLNAKQVAFINFYLVDFNATQAAVKAGYSPKSATVQGSILLSNPKVQAEVNRRKAALAARSEITRDWLVKELAAEFEEARRGVEHRDKAGNVTVTRKPDAVVRLGELIARMHGWTVDDRQPGGTNQTLVNFVIQR